MTSPAFRCADAARERGDPPLGTAPTSDAFLLIEHTGPWRYDALAGAGWPEPVTAALTAAARARRARLLLIRRPGRRPAGRIRAWAVAQVGGGTRWGSWREAEDLLAAADALRAAGPDAVGPDPARPDAAESPPPPVHDPLLLVCTHGIHDTCCALRGRPVAAALARRWPDATWECSHVGGDRFAANLVVLPDGTSYGGLDAEVAPDVVAGHLGGRLDAAHLRGSVRWRPPAQVAVGEIHRRFGPYAADDVAADRCHDHGTARWQVEVSVPEGRRFAVEVTATRRPAAVLTCSAHRASTATDYRVVAVEEDRRRPGVTIS